MMIATHIIKPHFCKKVSALDAMSGYKSCMWYVKADTKHIGTVTGKFFQNETDAVNYWNEMFSKAPKGYGYE